VIKQVITVLIDCLNDLPKTGQRIAAGCRTMVDCQLVIRLFKRIIMEYNLSKDETVNAWCMPGEKIVFYTGI